jgi:hypothetical protein
MMSVMSGRIDGFSKSSQKMCPMSSQNMFRILSKKLQHVYICDSHVRKSTTHRDRNRLGE